MFGFSQAPCKLIDKNLKAVLLMLNYLRSEFDSTYIFDFIPGLLFCFVVLLCGYWLCLVDFLSVPLLTTSSCELLHETMNILSMGRNTSK